MALMLGVLDIFLGFYIYEKGGANEAIASGFLGNMACFIIFMTPAVYLSMLIWSLPYRRN
ncbi:hypothetical protein [Pectobacterium aroidearum]|uniref:hypothetical protein n=1 Tax=Pectobacterium aroidearum TaxID=1201031 RepID=UPI0032EBE272